MKAINHPTQGLMLVADDVPTDPTVTFPFVDADPPSTQPGELATQALVLDGDVVRRTWTVLNPVPEDVPLWAFRASLVLGGITQSQVDALTAGLQEPAKTVATIQWNYGNYIERGHTLIGQLGAQLGLSSNQIDDVFRTAASLK
jgi:hypothetical protein